MLKLQYFGHLMQRANSLEKTPKLGKVEGRRRGNKTRWLDGITNSVNIGLSIKTPAQGHRAGLESCTSSVLQPNSPAGI